MSNNDSTTIEGSDGSTFEIDSGDRDPSNRLLIPLIETGSKDAERVVMQNHQNLSSLTPEQRANLDIPSPAEQHAAGVRGDAAAQISTGFTQDQITVDRLSDELGTLQATEAKYIANGSSVPDTLRNAIRAKMNTINFQMDAMRKTAAAEAAAASSPVPKQLQDVYDSNFTTAVLREQRNLRRKGMSATPEAAAKVVEVKIKTEGLAAVLPQYSSVLARTTS